MLREYRASDIEKKWQDWWEAEKIYTFEFESDKPYYSIDNPPRYASGALHMGHATHYTHIDFVARYKRLRGYNVFFPLCFDVNGTPIEVNVEKKRGITKKSVSRQEFIRLCSEFAESNIGEMTRQFKILGESMDPTIYYQTDAQYYRRLTQISFVRLFKQNLVYKGTAPVNWCPRCETALADAEVEYRERETLLNYIKFYDDAGEPVTIATTRPELLCTCQLVAVHPEDENNYSLAGGNLYTPIYNKKVRVVADEKVDPNFGTGVVMICTIGDKDDLEWVHKYGLPVEMAIDREGRMTGLAGKYQGMKIEEARKAVIEDLKQQNLLVKQLKISQNVGTCWRCHTPIEFLSLPQWYLKIIPYKKMVLEAANKIIWHPEFMKVRLIDWVNSLNRDWVISRQRYFATPIPVWECVRCGFAVPAEEHQCYVDPTVDNPPVEKCPKCGGELKGSEEVFDTWMDSSISPLYNAFWERDNEKFRKYYPMSIRTQAHDIIRTWAYYTILRCMQLTNEIPWKEIMVDGHILAPDGTPMHASAGNAIDPLPLLEKYGADAWRYFCAKCAIGEDTPFQEKELVHGSRFVNKYYNINRFIENALNNWDGVRGELMVEDRWILSRYARCVEEVTVRMENFEFPRALHALEEFVWHQFADHYLEMVKHRTQMANTRYTLFTVGSGITKMLAIFVPHVTEEVYQGIYRKFENAKSVHLSSWPEPPAVDEEAEVAGEFVKEVIAAVRRWKVENLGGLGKEIKRIVITGKNTVLAEKSIETIAKTLRAGTVEVKTDAKVDERVSEIALNMAKAGPYFKEKIGAVQKAVKNLKEIGESQNLELTLDNGEKVQIPQNFITVKKTVLFEGRDAHILTLPDCVVIIER
ncbi:MAG: valine--tRNA ligase [Thermoplasmata archaeon]|nr:valine--tRNA ligase [Thermoplasmata archaeon]